MARLNVYLPEDPGFTVAADNLDRIRSFRANQAELASAPKQQPKIRRGTWARRSGTFSQLPKSSRPAHPAEHCAERVTALRGLCVPRPA